MMIDHHFDHNYDDNDDDLYGNDDDYDHNDDDDYCSPQCHLQYQADLSDSLQIFNLFSSAAS